MNFSNLVLLSKFNCLSYSNDSRNNLLLGGSIHKSISQRIGYTLPRQPRAKASQVNQVINNDILLKYNYSLSNVKKQRRLSLVNIFNNISHLKIFNYLTNLKNLNKLNKKELNRLNDDLKWIKINYIEK